MTAKIGMLLLVRDECDVIVPWLDYHLPKIDNLYVTDNGSVDTTFETLLRYQSKYPNIQIIAEKEQNYNQAVWCDRMVKMAIADGCTHVASSDADELWSVNFRDLAKEFTPTIGAFRLGCRLYVPTVWDDMTITNPFNRMKYYVKKGRTIEECQTICAWGKCFFSTESYKNIELGNDKVYFTDKNLKIIDINSDVRHIKHYPNRSWNQFRNKVVIGGEAWAKSTMPKNYGWHIRLQYSVYSKGGITALKRFWYEMAEDKLDVLNKD
jgi:HKD family nuclease